MLMRGALHDVVWVGARCCIYNIAECLLLYFTVVFDISCLRVWLVLVIDFLVVAVIRGLLIVIDLTV